MSDPNERLRTAVLGLGRQFRRSHLPPLMIFVADGRSGLTAIRGISASILRTE